MGNGTIQSYETPKAKYHSQKNKVLSITECQQYAIRYTNSEGKESMCLVNRFGKTPDGRPGIFLLADEKQMSTQLRSLPEKMLEQVLAHLEKLDNGAAAAVADEASVANALEDFSLDEGASDE